MTTNKDMLFVANLQIYAQPYSVLYMDREHGKLCLFVRITSPTEGTPRYVATEVTSSQIERYMQRRLGLKSIFSKHECYLASINGTEVSLELEKSFVPTKEMKHSNMFDPEYCMEGLKLKMFLRRFNNNQYT